jgi:DNA-binding CsgD family transcriptional regulator
MPAFALRRRRITDRIAATRGVALIFAPAGCGKSIALSQFLEELEEPWLRFDVRTEHSEPLGFARGLAESARAISPGARLSVADAVRSASSVAQPSDFLADWMTAHLAGFRGTIALDDVHRAVSEPANARFLGELIERTRSTIRWVVAGRSSGILPVARWIDSGIAELVAADRQLRFTAMEAREAASSLSEHFCESLVDDIVEQTSGWAAAFFLTLQIHRSQPQAPAAAAAAREFSYDYVAYEIYQALSAQERSLLEFAALLPEMDAEVLTAAGFEHANAQLDALTNRLFSFLTPVPGSDDGASARYQCHDLFREFLDHRIGLLDATVRDGMKRRAAVALESCGQAVPAMRLFSQAGSVAEVLRLIERDGFEFVARGHEDALEAVLQALPREYATHFTVLAIRGRQAYHNAQTDQAVALLERAAQASSSRAYIAQLRLWQGIAMMAHYNDPIAVLEPVAADSSLAPELQADLNCVLLGAYLQRDLTHNVDGLFKKIAALAEVVPSDVDRSRLYGSLGRFTAWRGDVAAAEILLRKASALASGAAAHREEAKAYEGLAGNAVSACRYDRALHFANLSAAAAEKCGARVSIISALCHRVTALVYAGRQVELDATLARMDALAPGDLAPVYTFHMRSGRAMSAAWNGDFAAAYAFSAKTCKTSQFWEARMIASARCAVYLAAAARRDEAVALAKSAMSESRSAKWSRPACGRYVELSLALCALTHAMCGDRSTMRRLLARKLRATTPGGEALMAAVRAIGEWDGVDPAPDVSSLFAAVERDWLGGYAKLLGATLRTMAKCAVDNPLLPAEREICRMLDTGMSPKDIAFERRCSVQTVRWHIKRTVKKLGCAGYRDAVRTARERNLL